MLFIILSQYHTQQRLCSVYISIVLFIVEQEGLIDSRTVRQSASSRSFTEDGVHCLNNGGGAGPHDEALALSVLRSPLHADTPQAYAQKGNAIL